MVLFTSCQTRPKPNCRSAKCCSFFFSIRKIWALEKRDGIIIRALYISKNLKRSAKTAVMLLGVQKNRKSTFIDIWRTIKPTFSWQTSQKFIHEHVGNKGKALIFFRNICQNHYVRLESLHSCPYSCKNESLDLNVKILSCQLWSIQFFLIHSKGFLVPRFQHKLLVSKANENMKYKILVFILD